MNYQIIPVSNACFVCGKGSQKFKLKGTKKIVLCGAGVANGCKFLQNFTIPNRKATFLWKNEEEEEEEEETKEKEKKRVLIAKDDLKEFEQDVKSIVKENESGSEGYYGLIVDGFLDEKCRKYWLEHGKSEGEQEEKIEFDEQEEENADKDGIRTIVWYNCFADLEEAYDAANYYYQTSDGCEIVPKTDHVLQDLFRIIRHQIKKKEKMLAYLNAEENEIIDVNEEDDEEGDSSSDEEDGSDEEEEDSE